MDGQLRFHILKQIFCSGLFAKSQLLKKKATRNTQMQGMFFCFYYFFNRTIQCGFHYRLLGLPLDKFKTCQVFVRSISDFSELWKILVGSDGLHAFFIIQSWWRSQSYSLNKSLAASSRLVGQWICEKSSNYSVYFLILKFLDTHNSQ